MSIAAATPDKLAIDRVIHRTIQVLQRNWRSLMRPALLYLYLPGLVVGLVRGPSGAPAVASLLSLLMLIPYTLFQGGLIRLTIADLRAEAISTDEAMAVGRRRLWPLFGLYLLTGLGVALGCLLLVVPGVLLALAWCVVGPVLIEEDRRVLQTFGRSAELTRGSRLNIFGVMLTLLVFEVIGVVALVLVAAPFPGLFGVVLLSPAYSALVTTVTGVVAPVIYDELRNLKPAIPA
jgi:hypothetical protein